MYHYFNIPSLIFEHNLDIRKFTDNDSGCEKGRRRRTASDGRTVHSDRLYCLRNGRNAELLTHQFAMSCRHVLERDRQHRANPFVDGRKAPRQL
jgi:hypothetical protein